jgi:hypothetical protein
MRLSVSTPQIVAETLPFAAQVNAAVATSPSIIDRTIVAPEGVGVIGSIYTHWDRANAYSDGSWSTSGPWTTWYAYNAGTDNSLVQSVNMALGDGYNAGSETTNQFLGASESRMQRHLRFASGGRLGAGRDVFHYSNSSSYAGHSFQLLPIRNTSSSNITINLVTRVSDYYSAGFEGTCLWVMFPNSSVPYQSVTTVTSTQLGSTQTSGNTSHSGNYTIPPQTTILVGLVSTDRYYTTYRFWDQNIFASLSTTFANSSIICDMRMLSALYTARFNLAYTGTASGTNLLAPIWTTTGLLYGNR